MRKILYRLILLSVLFFVPLSVFSQQQQQRIQTLQKKLDSLSSTMPGLKQKVQLQVVGGSIQAYLSGIATSNNLNISVDPKLAINVSDSFNDATAENILVFMAQKYSLDFNIIGSIITVTAYQEMQQTVKSPIRPINVIYNSATNTLSMSLANDSLAAVAKKITQISGKNVVVPNSMQNKTVTAFIADAPFETALDKMAFNNEIKMIKTNDNFYVFQPLSENEELYINGDKSTAVRHTFKPVATGGQGGTAQLFVRTVNGQKLISADATNGSIAGLVKQASQQLNKSYSLYTDLKGTIDVHVNDITYEEFLNLLFRGTTYTFQQSDGVYLIGDRGIEGLRTYKAIHLQSRSLDTVVSMIPTDWKKGIEIKEFREQNTIFLSGAADQIKEVENFIKQMDVLVPVVLVEVTMIDFHHTRAISTGISAGVSDSVKTGGTILPGVNFTFSATSINNFLSSLSKFTSINLGHVVPNFYAQIQAAEANNNADIRAVPKLTALNGHTAKLSMGNKEYYKNTTQSLYPTSATSTSVFTNSYTPVDANLEVIVKPVVSGDDQVTMSIAVNVSNFTSTPTDGSPPSEAINKFETSLRVHSEDTILLGGIERTENDLTANGIPVLSRIPVLKWIFGSRTKTTSKVTTVLFLKTTILR